MADGAPDAAARVIAVAQILGVETEDPETEQGSARQVRIKATTSDGEGIDIVFCGEAARCLARETAQLNEERLRTRAVVEFREKIKLCRRGGSIQEWLPALEDLGHKKVLADHKAAENIRLALIGEIEERGRPRRLRLLGYPERSAEWDSALKAAVKGLTPA
jgi:hypothetical protein